VKRRRTGANIEDRYVTQFGFRGGLCCRTHSFHCCICDIFNRGEGGFKDRDLYVFCANASDSVQTAHPTGLGARLKDFKDVKGFAFGEEIMRTAIQNGGTQGHCCMEIIQNAAEFDFFQPEMSVVGRYCSLIPGLGVKLSNDHPCRAHCSLRGRGDPSA
jgi:hypothetical protein